MATFSLDELSFDWSHVLRWNVPRITCPKANHVEAKVHSYPKALGKYGRLRVDLCTGQCSWPISDPTRLLLWLSLHQQNKFQSLLK